jgi:hypothetical protein
MARARFHRRWPNRLAVWLVVLVIGGAGGMALPASLARADQTPAGCTQNNLVLNIGRDITVVRNGDTIHYTVSVSNLNSAQGPACNISDASVVFTAPAADGTPTGAKTVLATAVNFPAGTTPTVLGTIPYVVAVNPGVTDTVAAAAAAGVLHDAPVNDQANVNKTLGSTITQPHTSLAVTVALSPSSPLKAVSPMVAHYTYVERNDSTTPAPMVSETVSDAGCAPVTYVRGDTNGNHILDPGEAWIYQCTRTLPGAGTFTDAARATGVDLTDGLPAPPESASVPATVAAIAKALPVTGPPVPLLPLGAGGLAAIALGVALCCLAGRRRAA